MQDILADYILLEDYFMTQNVSKAMQHAVASFKGGEPGVGGGGPSSEPSSSEPLETDPTVSVLLDDVFFVLKKCVQRSIAGSNVDGVCAVVNNACRILEQDFCGMLQSQVRLCFEIEFLSRPQ